ncbi:MAG: hypothetical protein IBJ11_05095 [Phycisphaerales bacterium]|nr:hypothetical protein [Phycisphaerales bacterium]
MIRIFRPLSPRGLGLLVSVSAAAAAVVAAPQALAQRVVVSQSTSVGSGGPGGAMSMFDAPISSRQLEKYARLLSLTPDQTASAQELFKSQLADFQSAAEEARAAMDEIRAEFQESQDAEVFARRMPDVQRRLNAAREKFEKTLFDDMRLTLDEAQLARWPAMQEARRRDQFLPLGSLSGEAVDLFRVAESLSFPAETAAKVDPLLASYSAELDKALAAREQVRRNQPQLLGPGTTQRLDPSELQKQLEELREAGRKVRDVNARHARQIASVLSADEAARFDAEVRKASFPQVYREPSVLRQLAAAERFDDLSADQKQALAGLREKYQREAAPINDRWAAALKEHEDAGGGPVNLGGGGAMVIRMGGGEDEPQPLRDARSARQDLDRRTGDAVRAALTPEQAARLPAASRAPGARAGAAAGGG